MLQKIGISRHRGKPITQCRKNKRCDDNGRQNQPQPVPTAEFAAEFSAEKKSEIAAVFSSHTAREPQSSDVRQIG